jgi:hypothetical protein
MRGDPLLYIHLFVDSVWVTVLYRQMAVDSVEVTALYIHGDLLSRPFQSELLRVSGSDCVAAPACDSSPYFLCVVTPLLYIHLFVDSVGVMVLYRQMAFDSVGVTALYIHGDLGSPSLSSELSRVSGSDCVATPVCDPSPTSILRGGRDNTANVSDSGGAGCAIFLDRRRWKNGGELGGGAEGIPPGVKTPVPCDAGRAKAKALAYPEARTTTTGRTRAGQGDPRLKPWATSHVLPGSDGDG